MSTYTRLTPRQDAERVAANKALLKLSQTRRRAFVVRRDMVQALKALHWGEKAAEEIADISVNYRWS